MKVQQGEGKRITALQNASFARGMGQKLGQKVLRTKLWSRFKTMRPVLGRAEKSGKSNSWSKVVAISPTSFPPPIKMILGNE